MLKRLRANQPGFGPATWVLLFCLAGFGLRLHRLEFQPLWGDEGWSFYFAGQSLPQLLALTAIDIHPPLYYLLLKTWLLAAGPGPAAARFLSVIAGTLLIPAAAGLGRRLFDWRTGLMAAAVTAVMPLAVYYSQEVRMYGLVTLLGLVSVYCFSRMSAGRPGRWVTAYILVTTAALYTMYYAAFIVLFQGLYLLLARLHRGGWRFFFAALAPLVYAGLLYLPWLVYAGPRLVSYVQNKRAVEGYAPLNFIRFAGDHLVAFSLGHLPPDLKSYAWAALPFVVIAALGFLGTLRGPSAPGGRLPVVRGHLYLYLLIPLLLGYAINQVFPFTPPFYERTLLLAAPAYWLLIAAGVIWLWDRQYLFVGTAVILMLVITTVSLLAFYHVPRYPQADYRPLLRDIAARATPADTLLASYQWQLGFYQAYLPQPQPHLFAVPGWGQGWAGQAGQARLHQDLAAIFSRSPRLWFPAYQAAGHMWEDQAEAAIAAEAYPALLQWYSPEIKLTLAGAAGAPLAGAPGANFAGLLTLMEARVGQDQVQAGRGIAPVELTWRKDAHLGSDYRVSLRLADAGGRTWASRDSYPQAGQSFFTDLAIGDTLADRHGLLVPAGTPPGPYRLLLSVRRVNDAQPLDVLDAAGQPLGAELALGQLTVTVPEPPVGPAALPVQVPSGAVFGGQARLVGYSLGDGPFKAGEALPLTLFWEALVDSPGSLGVVSRLYDAAGQSVVSHEAPPIWPATEWRKGSLLRDPHDLRLPPTLPPGTYHLAVGLAHPEQGRLLVDGAGELELTTVTTVDRPHVLAAPNPQVPLAVSFNEQARLVGLDLPRQTVKPGEPLALTLYWQAAAPLDRNWKVFVHLVDEAGQIVSQQDQIPGGGQFPTTGWLPGEYLVDQYNLVIPPDQPAGPAVYRLAIGLYDANDFSRLPVVETGKITGDQLVLDNWPISISQ